MTLTVVDDEANVLVYSRYNDEQEVITAFNRSDHETTVDIPVQQNKAYTSALGQVQITSTAEGQLSLQLPAHSGVVIGTVD